jgi:hypothetical protein
VTSKALEMFRVIWKYTKNRIACVICDLNLACDLNFWNRSHQFLENSASFAFRVCNLLMTYVKYIYSHIQEASNNQSRPHRQQTIPIPHDIKGIQMLLKKRTDTTSFSHTDSYLMRKDISHDFQTTTLFRHIDSYWIKRQNCQF